MTSHSVLATSAYHADDDDITKILAELKSSCKASLYETCMNESFARFQGLCKLLWPEISALDIEALHQHIRSQVKQPVSTEGAL